MKVVRRTKCGIYVFIRETRSDMAKTWSLLSIIMMGGCFECQGPYVIRATSKLCLESDVFIYLPVASANHDILNSDHFLYPRFHLWWQRENIVLWCIILLTLHSLVIITLLHLHVVYISNPRFEANMVIIRWPLWIKIYRVPFFRLDLISFYLLSR